MPLPKRPLANLRGDVSRILRGPCASDGSSSSACLKGEHYPAWSVQPASCAAGPAAQGPSEASRSSSPPASLLRDTPPSDSLPPGAPSGLRLCQGLLPRHQLLSPCAPSFASRTRRIAWATTRLRQPGLEAASPRPTSTSLHGGLSRGASGPLSGPAAQRCPLPFAAQGLLSCHGRQPLPAASAPLPPLGSLGTSGTSPPTCFGAATTRAPIGLDPRRDLGAVLTGTGTYGTCTAVAPPNASLGLGHVASLARGLSTRSRDRSGGGKKGGEAGGPQMGAAATGQEEQEDKHQQEEKQEDVVGGKQEEDGEEYEDWEAVLDELDRQREAEEEEMLTNVLSDDVLEALTPPDEELESMLLMRDVRGVPGLPPLPELLEDPTGEEEQQAMRRSIEEAKQQQQQAARVRKVDELGRAYGTGRRKTSTARVWIQEGIGKFSVNGRLLDVYFGSEQHRSIILQPFLATGTLGMFDVTTTVKGGGVTGQAGAIVLGISRALQNFAPEWRPDLKQEGLLTRDPRMVERKKPGKAKARKSFQWVKR